MKYENNFKIRLDNSSGMFRLALLHYGSDEEQVSQCNMQLRKH